VVVILAVVRPWSRSVEDETTSPEAATAPSRDDPAPKAAPAPAEAIAPPQSAAQPTRSGAEAIPAAPGTSAPSAMPTVATAQLCTALSNWRCETAASDVPPGPTFFYTQVKSATATTIEHRWYQGERLHRAVQLRIEANPSAGYRTFSRTTISADRAGDWRVELRSADGTVLHEARFAVREPGR
jgi:hypothetical protein